MRMRVIRESQALKISKDNPTEYTQKNKKKKTNMNEHAEKNVQAFPIFN